MVALYSVAIFFLVLLLTYPAAAIVISLSAWFKKRRVMDAEQYAHLIEEIDEQTDRLKNRAFTISIIIVFFVIAPFFALLMILKQ